MTKITRLFLLSFLFVIVASAPILARSADNAASEELGIDRPKLLPGHPLYFLKEGWRKTREILTFDPVKKLNLKERFVSERLLEIQELVSQKKNAKIINRATEKYKKETEQIGKRVNQLKSNASQDPSVKTFLEKYIHQELIHNRILQKLEEQAPEQALEKIREQNEMHLERFKKVMLKLEKKENIPVRLQEAVEEIIQGGRIEETEVPGMLERIERQMPEEIREKIKARRLNIKNQIDEKVLHNNFRMPSQ